MNAIRDRANFSADPPRGLLGGNRYDEVEPDVRGEMRVLQEEGRRSDITGTWNNGS